MVIFHSKTFSNQSSLSINPKKGEDMSGWEILIVAAIVYWLATK